MRYMGDFSFNVVSTGPLDPAVKAQMMTYAATMSDAQAQDFIDVTDATPLGKRTKYLRMGLGAVGGVVVGLLLAKSKKKR